MQPLLSTVTLLAISFCQTQNAPHAPTPEGAKEAAERAQRAAKGSYGVMDHSLYRNISAHLPAFRWSKRWMDAETWIDPAQRLAAAKAHYARARTLHRYAEDNPRSFPLDSADYYLADAEVLAQQAGALIERSGHDAIRRRADAAQRWYSRVHDRLSERVTVTEAGLLIDLLELAQMCLEAELAASHQHDARLAVVTEYVRRVQQLGLIIQHTFAKSDFKHPLAVATYFQKDAIIVLAAENQTPESATAAAKDQLQAASEVYQGGAAPLGSVEWYYRWSSRWRDAALAVATSNAARIAAADDHLKRLRQLRIQMEAKYQNQLPQLEDFATAFYVAEAEYLDARSLQKGASR